MTNFLHVCFSAGDAGGGAGDAGTQTTETTDTTETTETAQAGAEGEQAAETFTQDDINRIVQATIAKERKRADAAVTKARTEAEKLAAMDADQRAEHERQQRETALIERENQITRRELRAQALETLGTKGLPGELVDMLDYQDADACKTSIDSIERTYRAAVQKGVESRMQGNAPKGGGGADPTAAFVAQARKAAGLKTK